MRLAPGVSMRQPQSRSTAHDHTKPRVSGYQSNPIIIYRNITEARRIRMEQTTRLPVPDSKLSDFSEELRGGSQNIQHMESSVVSRCHSGLGAREAVTGAGREEREREGEGALDLSDTL